MKSFSNKLTHNLLDEAVFELDLGNESNEEVAKIMTVLANQYYESPKVIKIIQKELTAMFSQYDVTHAAVKRNVREELDNAYRRGYYSEMWLYYFLLMILTFKNILKPVAHLAKYKGKMFTLQLFLQSMGYTSTKSGENATMYFMLAQLLPTLHELKILSRGLEGFYSVYGVPSEFKMTVNQMIVAEEVLDVLPTEYQQPIRSLLFDKPKETTNEKPNSTKQETN